MIIISLITSRWLNLFNQRMQQTRTRRQMRKPISQPMNQPTTASSRPRKANPVSSPACLTDTLPATKKNPKEKAQKPAKPRTWKHCLVEVCHLRRVPFGFAAHVDECHPGETDWAKCTRVGTDQDACDLCKQQQPIKSKYTSSFAALRRSERLPCTRTMIWH